MERVFFYPVDEVKSKIDAAYEMHRSKLAAILPSFEIHHIGSTTIPNSITKGDLDILIRTDAPSLDDTERRLTLFYERNLGSDRTATFTSFKDDDLDPPLGIQVRVRNGPEDDFLNMQKILIANPHLNEKYNQIKRSFHGKSMDEYRVAKSAFLEELLRGNEAKPR